MPVVLVHGVPETERVWDGLREHLSRDDVVALRLPGFGRSRPDGFGATMDEYAGWLVGEVQGIDQPVDLVGHDWGGAFVQRLVSLRPDLVRTWATDAAGLADPDFVWHQIAQVWQTPDEGEAFMEAWLAPGADRSGMFAAVGAAPETAEALAQAIDRTMADSILTLYRSAIDVHRAWGPDFADVPQPGLVILADADPYHDASLGRRAAQRAGARIASMDRVGHWWMLSEPARSARVLEEFWSSAADPSVVG